MYKLQYCTSYKGQAYDDSLGQKSRAVILQLRDILKRSCKPCGILTIFHLHMRKVSPRDARTCTAMTGAGSVQTSASTAMHAV